MKQYVITQIIKTNMENNAVKNKKQLFEHFCILTPSYPLDYLQLVQWYLNTFFFHIILEMKPFLWA